MSLTRLPVIVRYDEKRLREQLNSIRTRRDKHLITIPFNDDGQILTVDVERLRQLERHAKTVLDEINLSVARESTSELRAKLWKTKVIDHHARYYGKEEWRVLLYAWTKVKQGDAFASGEDLSTVFINDIIGKGKEDAFTKGHAVILKSHLQPEDSKGKLIEIGFELQKERDNAELFREFAPRVILLALSVFPVSRVPVLLGWIIQAVTGFLQFMQFMEDAEEDGEITEEEANEAYWTLAGIVPFNMVQNALLLRAVGVTAIALLGALMSGIIEFVSMLPRIADAYDEGWTGYGEYDEETCMFIPDYAIPNKE